MKKVFFSLLVIGLSLVYNTSSAQELYDVNIKLGVGIRPTFFPGGSSGEYGPYGISIGAYFQDNLSFDVLLGVSGARVREENDLGDFYDARYGYLTTGLRINYDFVNEGFGKMYVGAMLGYHRQLFTTFTSTGFDGDPDIDRPFPIAYGIYLGTDVNLSEKIGLFGEVGYGMSLVRFGISIDLKK